MSNKIKVIFLLVLLGINACSEDNEVVLETPLQKSDGIITGSAKEQGFNVKLLSTMIDELNGGNYSVNSVLIAKNNYLVLEEYFQESAQGITAIQSVTKSITSALAGIAVDQYNLLADTPVINFFPELANLDWGDEKESITVQNLLTMSSGLQWNESALPYNDPLNDHNLLNQSDDWIEFILSRPMTSSPGSVFNYNSGLSIVLGEIIKRQTNQSIGQLSISKLFSKMDTEFVSWFTDDSGIFQTGGGLSFLPRDMLKFGLLYQNNGVWNGEQLLSTGWVQQSTTQQGPNAEYAYHWWLTSFTVNGQVYESFYAWGNGGQFIVVINELPLVIVFTASNFENNLQARENSWELITNYIIPSSVE